MKRPSIVYHYIELCIFFLYLYLSKQDSTENGLIEILEYAEYPIIFVTNDNFYNIITVDWVYIVNEETNSKINQDISLDNYYPPLFIFKDIKTNDYYFITKEINLCVALEIDNNLPNDFYGGYPLDNSITYFGVITDIDYYNSYIYDTLNNYVKILCGINSAQDELICHIIRINESDNYVIDFNNPLFYHQLVDKFLINSRENCIFTEFNSEYLLCCAFPYEVICERYFLRFSFKNSFSFNFEENNHIFLL